MSRLYCLEPSGPGPEWQPFAGARPLAELRAGAWRIRERWAALAGAKEVLVADDRLAGFVDADAAPCVGVAEIRGPAIVARSDFLPSSGKLVWNEGTSKLVHDGRAVAWKIGEGQRWTGPDEQGDATPIEGLALRGSWELLTALERLLPDDCAALAGTDPDPVPAGSIVLGDPSQVACFGALVEPGVVFDVRHGAVVLEEGTRVLSGTRLEGPLFVTSHSILLGGAIRHSAIGPHCRVHGEVASSIFLGYANKSHDGFLGHSVIGQWVNLGAGTTTSNLKNTYGEVRLELDGKKVATGRMFVGTLFGDHVKTGIGTLFSTGTVLGAGAHVLGTSPPRAVPPFAWAGGSERLNWEGFLRIAKRVMPRRQVEVTPAVEATLRALHQRLSG